MYSRATPFEKSDKMIGTHQKIDRAARLILKNIYSEKTNPNLDSVFPKINQILRFEGTNGPDGIKMKSPGKDEPWHFVEPYGDLSPMIRYIENHIYNLAEAIKNQNEVRASFEAAWLAHTLTDALTPAHQYPMEDKIIELSGKSPSERDKIYKKVLLPGDNWREKFKINWEYIGPKGVMSSHMLYELGVAMLISPIAPRKFAHKPTKAEIKAVINGEFIHVFEQKVKLIADQHYYDYFMKNGWTNNLARKTREDLLPEISKLVALGWLAAIVKSKETAK